MTTENVSSYYIYKVVIRRQLLTQSDFTIEFINILKKY
nr:MAG TPA: hypothetical protein [Caudoviricetes sp.]